MFSNTGLSCRAARSGLLSVRLGCDSGVEGMVGVGDIGVVGCGVSSQRLCCRRILRGMLTGVFGGDSDCAVYEPAVGADPFGHTYGYDPVGNITGFTGISGWSYGTGNEPGPGDAGPHAVTSAGGVTYTYDDAGNQTGRTQAGATTAYSYNADGWLSSITPSAGAGWVFRYDADGGRVRVQHGPGAFTYHIGGLLEVDTTAAGGAVTATRSVYRLGGGVTAVRTNTESGGSWTPAGSDRVDYTFGDHLGSVSAVWTEGDPGTRFLQRYYPWGAPRPVWNAGLPTNHTFTGQEADQAGGTASGLMFYQARYYDPRVGRFTQPDTLVPDPADPQAYNRYQYVRNNPTNWTDPSGHCTPPGSRDPFLPGGWVMYPGDCGVALGGKPATPGVPPAPSQDPLIFAGGTMPNRANDTGYLNDLVEVTGRTVHAMPPGCRPPA